MALCRFPAFTGNYWDGLGGGEKAAPWRGLKVQRGQGVPHGGVARRPWCDSELSIFQPGKRTLRGGRGVGQTWSQSSRDGPKFRPGITQSPAALRSLETVLETTKSSLNSESGSSPGAEQERARFAVGKGPGGRWLVCGDGSGFLACLLSTAVAFDVGRGAK